jgi:hypothetical protein
MGGVEEVAISKFNLIEYTLNECVVNILKVARSNTCHAAIGACDNLLQDVVMGSCGGEVRAALSANERPQPCREVKRAAAQHKAQPENAHG